MQSQGAVPLPSSSSSFFSRYAEKILLLSTLGGIVFSVVPVLLTTITMLRIYTIYEALLAGAVAFFAVAAAIIAFVAWKRKSSLLYLTLYFGFNMILAGVFSLLSPFWIVVVVIEVLGLKATRKAVSRDRRFLPRFRSKTSIALTFVAFFSLATPIAVYFAPPEISFTVEVDTSHIAPNLEINFALANISAMPDDLLDILTRCNALPKINVTLEMPILEELIMNTTKLVGVPFPDQSAMVKDYSEYASCDEYKAALSAWDDAWKHCAQVVRDNITAMTYEQLWALPTEYFDTVGLVVNQSKKLAANGLAIDYMPLLGESTYLNDATIERTNKTLNLMKRFIEINNLQTAHRGIVFDTERMWGQDLELILQYYDLGMHSLGLENLGKMVKMCKEWEYEWKGGPGSYGPYSEANWQTYMVHNRVTSVGSATFGIHIDDLWDLDDTQQNLFKISIMTAAQDTQFDFTGIMTYETGENSEQAVYSYCRAGDFFFGNCNVPYIYSGLDNLEDYKDNPLSYVTEITRKFRIAQNYGYSAVGIWGLTSIYCYSDCGEEWCSGLYDFLRAFHTPEAIYWMCQNLTVPEAVTFTCNSFKFAYTHPALTLLDAYLFSDIRYSPNWPLNNNARIRPDEFW